MTDRPLDENELRVIFQALNDADYGLGAGRGPFVYRIKTRAGSIEGFLVDSSQPVDGFTLGDRLTNAHRQVRYADIEAIEIIGSQ
jgi:hypothetical protein